MPTFKKIVVSGSAISQLSNDAGYLASAGGGIVSSSTQIIAGLATTGIVSSSAQIATDISGAFTAASGGFSTRITTNTTNITTNTTNIATNTTNIGTLTAATSSYALAANISGAFTAVSTSIAGRTTVLEGTGTPQGVGTTDNVTFANVTATGNVSITGTLFVDGTTTTINSTNLNIEDKFILLNSGSTGGSPTEGGIIVESGSTGTGNAFYYDSTDNRWSLKAGASGTTGGLTAEAFMSTVILASTASVQSAGTYYKAGNIVINASGIFILDDTELA